LCSRQTGAAMRMNRQVATSGRSARSSGFRISVLARIFPMSSRKPSPRDRSTTTTASSSGMRRRTRLPRDNRMLSRRIALAGLALAGQSRTAVAQHKQEEAQTELILLAADGQADSVQTVNDIAARLGGP